MPPSVLGAVEGRTEWGAGGRLNVRVCVEWERALPRWGGAPRPRFAWAPVGLAGSHSTPGPPPKGYIASVSLVCPVG